jgi:hypothetical protein
MLTIDITIDYKPLKSRKHVFFIFVFQYGVKTQIHEKGSENSYHAWWMWVEVLRSHCPGFQSFMIRLILIFDYF